MGNGSSSRRDGACEQGSSADSSRSQYLVESHAYGLVAMLRGTDGAPHCGDAEHVRPCRGRGKSQLQRGFQRIPTSVPIVQGDAEPERVGEPWLLEMQRRGGVVLACGGSYVRT